jgi:hypothetical protein
MYNEKQDIISRLPVEPFNRGYGKEPNAYVYIDHAGRLCALLASGEWLGTEIENVEGDQAPFCG